jgi:hypothetical protein
MVPSTQSPDRVGSLLYSVTLQADKEPISETVILMITYNGQSPK